MKKGRKSLIDLLTRQQALTKLTQINTAQSCSAKVVKSWRKNPHKMPEKLVKSWNITASDWRSPHWWII